MREGCGCARPEWNTVGKIAFPDCGALLPIIQPQELAASWAQRSQPPKAQRRPPGQVLEAGACRRGFSTKDSSRRCGAAMASSGVCRRWWLHPRSNRNGGAFVGYRLAEQVVGHRMEELNTCCTIGWLSWFQPGWRVREEDRAKAQSIRGLWIRQFGPEVGATLNLSEDQFPQL